YSLLSVATDAHLHAVGPFSFSSSGAHRALPSFPTRRSSDLEEAFRPEDQRWVGYRKQGSDGGEPCEHPCLSGKSACYQRGYAKAHLQRPYGSHEELRLPEPGCLLERSWGRSSPCAA